MFTNQLIQRIFWSSKPFFYSSPCYPCSVLISFMSKSLCSTESSSKYHSSLYVSSKYGQEMFRVIQPSYDYEYLNYLADNVEEIKSRFMKRSIESESYFDGDSSTLSQSLKQFATLIKKTDSLKKKRNRTMAKIKQKDNVDETLKQKFSQLHADFNESRKNLFALEEKLIPFLLNIPNHLKESVTEQPNIIEQVKLSKDELDGPFCHNYVRLGYINKLYEKSIVGPNSNYLIGEGALLYYALIDMMSDILENSDFVLIQGLDIVKSAIVEGVNFKPFAEDPFMLQLSSGRNEDNQRFHLVGESSLESLCAFLTKYHNEIVDQKFYQIGSSYSVDPLEQIHSIRSTILCESNQSDKAMQDLYKLHWDFLDKIGLQRLSLRADIESLYANEYDKYLLMAWLRSRSEWIKIGEISHFHHYICQRLGFSDYQQKHLVSSTIELIPLIYTLVEQYQIFATGHLQIPAQIKKYFM